MGFFFPLFGNQTNKAIWSSPLLMMSTAVPAAESFLLLNGRLIDSYKTKTPAGHFLLLPVSPLFLPIFDHFWSYFLTHSCSLPLTCSIPAFTHASLPWETSFESVLSQLSFKTPRYFNSWLDYCSGLLTTPVTVSRKGKAPLFSYNVIRVSPSKPKFYHGSPLHDDDFQLIQIKVMLFQQLHVWTLSFVHPGLDTLLS